MLFLFFGFLSDLFVKTRMKTNRKSAASLPKRQQEQDEDEDDNERMQIR